MTMAGGQDHRTTKTGTGLPIDKGNKMSDGTHLPRYKSHKIVNAAKIRDLVWNPNGSVDVFFEPDNIEVSGEAPSPVNIEMPDAKRFTGIDEKEDKGYLVVYNDGKYLSWSPTPEFDDGYTREDG